MLCNLSTHFDIISLVSYLSLASMEKQMINTLNGTPDVVAGKNVIKPSIKLTCPSIHMTLF